MKIVRLCALVLVSFLGVAAQARAGIILVPQHPSQTLHYRLTRTMLLSEGTTNTSATDFTLKRPSAAKMVLERRNFTGSFDVVVLDVAADGTLSVPAADTTDRNDSSLSDVLAALNRAITIVAGDTAAAGAGWDAALTMSQPGGTQAKIDVPIAVTSGPGGLTFRGAGAIVVAASPSPARRGGFGGITGGFGGRGSRGAGDDDSRASSDAAPAPRGPSMTLDLRVEGTARGGLLALLSVVEIRSLKIDELPFVNQNGWTLAISN